MRTNCNRCKKKTTETWEGWCQECIDKHEVIQEALGINQKGN